jgi:hypothetical protein
MGGPQFACVPRRERVPVTEREGTQVALALVAANNNGTLDVILWIIAAVLVIAGIVSIIRGAILWGIILIIVGLLVGPGGVSIFT